MKFSSKLMLLLSITMLMSFSEKDITQKDSHLNTELSPEERAALLIEKMTLEEKVAQLCSHGIRRQTNIEEGIAGSFNFRTLAKHGMGQLENPFDERKALESVRIVNSFQKFLIDSTRLKIPANIGSECLHGHAAHESTIFPAAIAMACTWNTKLVNKAFDIIGREARLRGSTEAHTPVLDLGRDPRWGRVEETYGEDTYLVSQMGLAAVTGLQGGTEGEPGTTHIISSSKHFAGYAQVAGGRNFAPTEIPERVFIDQILAPFETVVTKGNALGIMASHCEVDGVPAHANHWLLTDILKEKWGFKGMVVSDYGDISRLSVFMKVAETIPDAAAMAIKAGMDVDLPAGSSYRSLVDVIKKQPELEKFLDASVLRVLTLKFKLGLFENPFIDETKTKQFVGCQENIKVAGEVANESIVLLKNKNNILPLDSDNIKSIAVIGPNANSTDLGGYTVYNDRIVTILEGIKAKVGEKCRVEYSEGCEIVRFISDSETTEMEIIPLKEEENKINEAVNLAQKSDVIIACVGGFSMTSREAVYKVGHKGDRVDINLLGNQEELLNRLIATGKPVVVILKGGKPYAIENIDKKADAILNTFYGGEQMGTAVSNVLFGDVNPSGKTSISFPKHVGQIPVFYSQKRNGFYKDYLEMDSRPLYPFGYGLSYTSFAFSDLLLKKDTISKNEQLVFSVKVKNIGKVYGAEVVQVYFEDKFASITRPEKLLVRFDKVQLNAGEEKTVRFTVTPGEDLSFTGINYQKIVEKGDFELMVGNSSDNIILRKGFYVAE